MADDQERHGADAFNSYVPKHEKQPSAKTGGEIDKAKLKAQIERQKEMAREDARDLARGSDGQG